MAVPTSFQIGTKVTAAEAAANYLANASGRGSWWAERYLKAKTDPFASAAGSADHWLAMVNQAGTVAFAAGLNRVDKAAVAKLVSTSGPSLYAAGITGKGAPKFAKAASGLIPALQQAAANLAPRGSLDQNIARSVAMQRAAAAMRGQHRG
jgi:hypothetical protein